MLHGIFLHVCGVHDYHNGLWRYTHNSYYHPWIHVSRLCKQWHAVALGRATLEDHVTVTTKRESMVKLLERSIELPLSDALDLQSTSLTQAGVPNPLAPRGRPGGLSSQLYRTLALRMPMDRHLNGSFLDLLDAPAPFSVYPVIPSVYIPREIESYLRSATT